MSNTPAHLRAPLWSSRIVLGFAIVAAAAAVALIAAHVLTVHPLQDNDYFAIMFEPTGVGETPFLEWLVRPSNEHFSLWPRLVYLANAYLFAGATLPLSLYALIVTLVQAVLLTDIARRQFGGDPFALAIMIVLIFALSFTPHAMHNFMRGFSGVQWLSANMFSVAALYLYQRGRRWAPVLPGFMASISYSTGLLIWPALLVFALLGRRPVPERLQWAVVSAVVLTAYLLLYERPSGHGEPGTNPGMSIVIAVAVLGGAWTNLVAAVAIGIAGILLFARLVQLTAAERKTEWVVWLALASQFLAAAATIGAGRGFLGYGVALSSRYATLSSLFWIGVLAPTIAAFFVLKPRRTARDWLVFAAVAVAATWGALSAQTEIRFHQYVQRAKQLYTTAMLLDVPFVSASGPVGLNNYFNRYIVTPGTFSAMRRTAHYPYVDWAGAEIACGLLGARLPGTRIGPVLDTSAVDAVWRTEPGRAILHGWLGDNGRLVDCIVIADPSGRIVGAAFAGFPRPEIAGRRPGVASGSNPGWIGIARVPAEGPLALRVYVRFAGEPHFRPLADRTRNHCGYERDAVLDRPIRADRSRVPGLVDAFEIGADGTAAARGWAIARDGRIACVLVVDRAGRVAGSAVLGGIRRDLERNIGSAAFEHGWRSVFRFDPAAGPYRFLAVLADEEALYRIGAPQPD